MIAKLNLAPEIYQASQRAKQRKQVATSIGVMVCLASVGVLVVSLIILGGQKIAVAALSNSIKNQQNQISQISDLPAAATAQQNLSSWSQLVNSEGKFSQFFQILQEFAPQGTAANSISVDNNNVITMAGEASSYAQVTKLAKALEASNVQVGQGHAASNQPYFSNVDLKGVSNTGSGTVSFQLTAQMSSEVTSGQ